MGSAIQRRQKTVQFGVIGLALLTVASGTVAAVRPAQAGSHIEPQSSIRAPLFDVRDAPVAAVLMMLLEAYDVDYSISPDLPGNVTLKASNEPYEPMLRMILEGNSVPLTSYRENVTYFRVKDSETGTKSASPQTALTASDFPVPQKVMDVPRRVAAVLVMPDYAQAIILDARESKTHRVAVGKKPYRVTVGDTIPAGIAGQEPLTVTKIDDKGVELTPKSGDQTPFRVALTDNYDSFLKKP